MTYRKNEGRYARMIAFWTVALLVGYGLFHGGGLIDLMAQWASGWDSVLVEPFPLLKSLKVSSLVTIGIYAAFIVILSRILSQPKLADLLIDTEAEMQKVSWPGWSEVAQGTMAVTAMVIVLFLFLTAVDMLMTKGVGMLLLTSSAAAGGGQ